MRVLVAEDEASTRLFAERAMVRLGHEVFVVDDGKAAWDWLREHPVDVVITDWIMPDVDGIELCRRIRAESTPNYIYTILLTSHGGKGNFLQAMDAGADDFVTKPLDIDTIGARLRVAERVLGLQAEVKQLQGLLPICSYCKKIRDDGDHWESIEAYIQSHTDAAFSHGVCPGCYEKWMQPVIDGPPNQT